MSGFAPPFPQPASAWQEHKTPEGRAYYYNNVTKVTQWTKPEEMMSSAEVSNLFFQASFALRFLSVTYLVPCLPSSNVFVSFHSALSSHSHGKSTPQRAVGSIGTIQRRSRALGRCLKHSRKLWVRLVGRATPFPRLRIRKVAVIQLQDMTILAILAIPAIPAIPVILANRTPNPVKYHMETTPKRSQPSSPPRMTQNIPLRKKPRRHSSSC